VVARAQNQVNLEENQLWTRTSIY